jgi:hypothetical protein
MKGPKRILGVLFVIRRLLPAFQWWSVMVDDGGVVAIN